MEPVTCPCPVLCESNLCSPYYFFEIFKNFILPSLCKSSKWSLSFMFPCQNPLCIYPPYVPCSAPIPSSVIWSLVFYSMRNANLKIPHAVSSSLFLLPASWAQKIFLSTLFLNPFCSSFNMGNQVLPTYATRGKILFLYVLIFIFWGSKWEEKNPSLTGRRHFLID